MLSFGKSKKNDKGLVRRRWFDTLVQVGPRVNNARTFDDLDLVSYVHTPSKTQKAQRPERIEFEIVHDEDNNDLDMQFGSPPIGGRYVDDTRRQRKKIQEEIAWVEASTHADDWYYQSRKHKLKRELEELSRNKTLRYAVPKQIGEVFIEEDPTGDGKIALLHARDWDATWRRTDNSWKSHAKRATHQWNRHEPTIHCTWSMTDEASATFLIWEREAELWQREYEEMVSREMDFDELIGSAAEILYWELATELDKLAELYKKGEWCLEGRDEDLTYMANAQFERDIRYQFGYRPDHEDDFDGLDEETWAWNQAAA